MEEESKINHSITNEVSAFLNKYYPAHTALKGINAGHHSNTYSFRYNNKFYIVRRSKDSYNYEKDKIISNLFKKTLKVPKVLCIKKFREYFYCVQPKIKGKTADTITNTEYKEVLTQIFDALTIIHGVNAKNFKGYGNWDKNKTAPFETWQEYLDDVHNETKWKKLSEKSSFNLIFAKKLYTQLVKLLPQINPKKSLIHGDFGRDNLIIVNKKINGIIDWGESKVGDKLYDIAWLDLWNPELQIVENYKKYINKRGIKIVNFKRRYMAAILEISISSLEWTAENLNEGSYKWLESRVKQALKFK